MTDPSPPDEPGSQPSPYAPPPSPYAPPSEHGRPSPYAPPPSPYAPPPAYGQPSPYAQPYTPDYLAPHPVAPIASPPKRRRLLAPLAAALVVVAGGAVTYVAISDSASGSSSPKDAVANFVSDMNSSDLLGMLDSLPPAERTAIADPLINDFSELKRVHVLSDAASLNDVSGIRAQATDLGYASTLVINDHVQIVQLISGTIRIDADASKLPLSSQLIHEAFPNGRVTASGSQSVDIAQAVRANGGHPIRIATEKVGGRWYPSVLYTIADNATTSAGLPAPTAADVVPAVGADSPTAAVRQVVTSLLRGDVAGAIKLASPDELAAVHEYGGVIERAVGRYAAPVRLDRLTLTSAPGPNGTTLVAVKALVARVRGLGAFSLTIDARGCVREALPGVPAERLCPKQASRALDAAVAQLVGRPLTAPQKRALQDVFSADTSFTNGIVTTRVRGKWFVNPIRTLLGTTTTALRSLQGDDVLQLIGLFK